MTKDIKGMTTKELVKEICYGDRHEEFASMIIDMQKEKPKLLELFCKLSDDLFEVNKRLKS